MRRWIVAILSLAFAPAEAQTIVTSVGPESVSVTIYRDPDRGEGAISARSPQGFALISEKRRLSLPAGDATLRFEGVAEGMIAVSAVVTGLPGGVVQKNRDARLLSPAALVDGTLGNRVHLRRTDPATGKVTEQDAIIRSTAANALVLDTAAGMEGLRCSGLPETLSFSRLPSGLSAKPTLSVSTSSPAAAEVEVTLTYLATGFDWSASYVAQLAPDGRTLSLFAWLTVANGDGAAFPQASLLAVAGRLNRTAPSDPGADDWVSPVLSLQCWRFEGYAAAERYYDVVGAPPPAPPPPPMAMMAAREDIQVTARRVAEQEDLGDLKLYRVPMAVDINPNGQKQVALLERKAIAFDSYYVARYAVQGEDDAWRPLSRMIRFPNNQRNGAGLPLPSGKIAIFTTVGKESLLLAEAPLADRAIGETVEIGAGQNAQLRASQGRGSDGSRRRLVVSNAGATAAPVEIELSDGQPIGPSHRLQRRNGQWVWKVLVPADGTAQLDYAIREGIE